MIDFVLEQLALLPFLFVTYLALEWLEAHTGGALERFLERARSVGSLVGSLAGVVPQCGFSAAAASLYSGGVITLGTLLAVFLSTSDELIPVLLSARAPSAFVLKLVAIKTSVALAVGFLVNGFIVLFRGRNNPVARIDELCEHSHCSCHQHKGVMIPALIHTLEIFVFVFIVSAGVELAIYYFGSSSLERLALNRPIIGEFIGAALGLIPNCAVSAAAADLYVHHPDLIRPGALMASSFSGCGLGLLVLFRTNRNFAFNLFILGLIYILGVVCGYLTGFLF